MARVKSGTGIVAQSAQTALPSVPIRWGYVGPDTDPDENGRGWEKVVDFDIELSAAAAESYTGLTLYGARPVAQVIADDDFTAANATEIFTAASHGLQTGDGPIRVASSGTLPDGLSAGTDYWVIRIDANTFRLAASLEDACDGTHISITTDGTGTHTLSDTDDTERLRHCFIGLLGPDRDGVLSLAANEMYRARVLHQSSLVAYAVIGTIAGSAATTLRLHAVSSEA